MLLMQIDKEGSMISSIVSIFAILGGILTLYHLYRIVYRFVCDQKVFSWEDIERANNILFDKIRKSQYKPDLIVGLGRGGAIVAGLLAAKFRESPDHGFRLIPISSIDRFYILEGKRRVEAIISGFHTLDAFGKNLLVVNADSYSGATLQKAKEVLLWDHPTDVKTGTVIAFTRKRKKPWYDPDYCGEKLPVEKAKKRLPWRTDEYSLDEQQNLELSDRVLVVLHGLVATGKTSAADAIVKQLGFTPLYSDWYWFKYGLQERDKDRGVSAAHNKHMLGRCWSALASGSDTVLDCTARWSSFRQELNLVFSQSGAKVVFVQCHCSEESAKQRIERRQIIGPHDFGTLYEYDRVKSDFQAISGEEESSINLIRVDTDKLRIELPSSNDKKTMDICRNIGNAIENHYLSRLRGRGL